MIPTLSIGVHVFMFLIQTLSFGICTFSIEMTRIGHSRVPPLWFYHPTIQLYTFNVSTIEWVSSNLFEHCAILTHFPRKVVSPLHKIHILSLFLDRLIARVTAVMVVKQNVSKVRVEPIYVQV